MIRPTVGRIVWYHPCASDDFPGAHDTEPLAAIVARVWSDTCVNLMVIDANGNTHSRTSILLVQDGEHRPDSGFAEWMPYQKQKAAAGDPNSESAEPRPERT